MIHFVLIIGLFLLAHRRDDGAPRAHDARPGRRPRRSSRSAPTASPARCPTSTAEAGPGLRARLGRPHRRDVGRWLGQRFSRLKGTDYRVAAGRGRHVHDDARSACSGRSSSPRSAARSSGSVLGAARRARSVARLLVGTVGAAVLGWVAPDVHRRPARARSAASRSSAGSRPDRPPRRDARGRAQLPAVAAPRRDEDQGAARVARSA